MECENCNSEVLEHVIINTNYRHNEYFDEYLKEDTVSFKCKECGYEWLETF